MRKISGPLTRRYGVALYDSILESSKKTGLFTFEQEVAIVRSLQAIFDKSVVAFLSSPILTNKAKNDLLEAVLHKEFLSEFKVSSEIMNFLQLIIENDRFEELPLILKCFLAKADEYLGVMRATVISARTLSPDDIKDFSASLSSTLHKKMVLETQTDQSLRSGFIIKIGNTKIDVSLRSHLTNLKESLNY